MGNKLNIMNIIKKEHGILSIIIFTIILITFLGMNSNASKMDDEKVIAQAMQGARAEIEKKLGTKIAINKDIISEQIEQLKKSEINTDQLSDEIVNLTLSNNNYYKIEAYEILINDSDKIVVKDKATATTLLDEIKNSYIPAESKNQMKEVSFVDDVTIMPVFASQHNIVTKEDAMNKLKATKEEIKKYVISEGDTLSEVANNHDMRLRELMNINPDINEESVLKIGQEINLSVPKPLVSVKTSEELIYSEPIQKTVEYQYDDSKFTDYSKVIQKGKDGVKEVTANSIRINGIEEEKIIVAEKVVEEPAKEIVVVGTKQFRIPVNGRLTSGFGKRWGVMHEGIDLAAPTGTSIYASESGKVVYSGWNDGGYGYLIKIDHGNGLITYYAHNSKNFVSVGDYVNRGDLIGAVGSTGYSTGSHVHFEIREDGVAKNPSDFL